MSGSSTPSPTPTSQAGLALHLTYLTVESFKITDKIVFAVSRGYKMQQEGKEKISEEFSYMLIAWSLLEKTRASHYSTQSGRRTRHRVGHYG